MISAGNTTEGVQAPVGASVTFTDSYSNALNYSAGLTLGSNYTTAATFPDEAGNDYPEASASFSIDTGDPIDAFTAEPGTPRSRPPPLPRRPRCRAAEATA